MSLHIRGGPAARVHVGFSESKAVLGDHQHGDRALSLTRHDHDVQRRCCQPPTSSKHREQQEAPAPAQQPESGVCVSLFHSSGIGSRTGLAVMPRALLHGRFFPRVPQRIDVLMDLILCGWPLHERSEGFLNRRRVD